MKKLKHNFKNQKISEFTKSIFIARVKFQYFFKILDTKYIPYIINLSPYNPQSWRYMVGNG